MYEIEYSKQAVKDIQKLKLAKLAPKAKELIKVLENNPFQNPPPYEKLVGDLAEAYSRRINRHHRILYAVLKKERKVRIIRMWTHYE